VPALGQGGVGQAGAAQRSILAEVERQLSDDPTDESAMWLARMLASAYAHLPGCREEWRP